MTQIEKETQRVFQEVENFKDLLENIRKSKYPTPHLERFKMLLEYLYDILKAQWREYVDELTSYGPSEEKSRRIEEFYSQIKCLFDFMYRAFLHSNNIPRELYYLSDTFLDYCGVSKDYIIFVSDDIAMLSLHDVLEALGFDPEFWKEMYKKEFYFVLILPEFSKMDAALDFPIILHEIAHIICNEKGLGERYLTEMSIREALSVVYEANRHAYPEFLVTYAKKKLYVNEHAADLLVTQCFGAIYGWRFLEKFFSIRNVFEPGRSHPSPKQRLQKISYEIKTKLNMPEASRFLDQELQNLTGVIESHSTSDQELNVNDILEGILDEVYSYSQFTLTCEKVVQCIQESSWIQTLKENGVNRIAEKVDKNLHGFLQELQAQLLRGIPLVICPPVLYFILTLDFSNIENIKELDSSAKEEARLIKEMIADCIRLYVVWYRFLRGVLSQSA